jgi:hypothetical protein
MYDKDYAKNRFEKLHGSDSDYLLICKESDSMVCSWNTIPHEVSAIDDENSNWETIEQAVRWHFDHGWDIVEIYDLYRTEFEKSMVRSVKKTNRQTSSKITSTIPQVIFIGDVVEFK